METPRDITLEILMGIREEIQLVRRDDEARSDRLRDDLRASVAAEGRQLRAEMAAMSARLGARLDAQGERLAEHGERLAGQGERLERVEAAVSRLESGVARLESGAQRTADQLGELIRTVGMIADRVGSS